MQIAFPKTRSGFTLIELTLVISVLLGLISVTFLGVTAYKNGSNRAVCIQNIASAQRAIRAYSNMYDFDPGQEVTNLRDRITGPGNFIPIPPVCPSTGTYTWGDGTDQIPTMGSVYLRCSISDHVPTSNSSW